MAFSTITGAFMGEDGRYDAFETTLEVLRAKAAHPGMAPEQLRQLDPEFDAFLDCRAHAAPPQPSSVASVIQTKGAVSKGSGADASQDGTRAAGIGALALNADGAIAFAAAKRLRAAAPVRSNVTTAAASDVAAAADLPAPAAIAIPLCSVSPFDAKDPKTPTCREVRGGRGALYGGLICARAPTDLVACPRPWE